MLIHNVTARYAEGSSFPDIQPTTINGDGDGTVNIRSLELCKKFKTLRDYKTVTGFLATHLEILQRQDVIQYLSDLLTKKKSRGTGEGAREAKESFSNQTMVF